MPILFYKEQFQNFTQLWSVTKSFTVLISTYRALLHGNKFLLTQIITRVKFKTLLVIDAKSQREQTLAVGERERKKQQFWPQPIGWAFTLKTQLPPIHPLPPPPWFQPGLWGKVSARFEVSQLDTYLALRLTLKAAIYNGCNCIHVIGYLLAARTWSLQRAAANTKSPDWAMPPVERG